MDVLSFLQKEAPQVAALCAFFWYLLKRNAQEELERSKRNAQDQLERSKKSDEKISKLEEFKEDVLSNYIRKKDASDMFVKLEIQINDMRNEIVSIIKNKNS